MWATVCCCRPSCQDGRRTQRTNAHLFVVGVDHSLVGLARVLNGPRLGDGRRLETRGTQLVNGSENRPKRKRRNVKGPSQASNGLRCATPHRPGRQAPS